MLEIETSTLPGLEPTASGHDMRDASALGEIEPAFDLSVADVDISPLEGLESAADQTAFAIDPEIGSQSLGVEGLVSSDPGLSMGEPGLGEPLANEDPLAGLNVLEDDRLLMQEELPSATPEAEADAVAEDEVPTIDTIELVEHHELHAAQHEPEPVAEEEEASPTYERDESEEEQAAIAESEQEEEVEEEEEERRAPPKPARPKLVDPVKPKQAEQSRQTLEPLRITRPKPKKGKTPAREEASSQRQPVNPFLRRPKTKPSPKAPPRVATPPAEVPRAATPKEAPPERSDDNFVDLGDWLREERGPRSTRMVAQEDHNRLEGEQADFTDMLEKFKAGVAANVDDEDYDSHYDLGVAYKEMGLIDEAVAEFQKALRGATQRIRAYEALGQCFIDRNEHDVAITVLGRALREPGMEDEDLIGVLYLLGFASEGSKKPRDAAAYYQRVFAIDIDFRDVSKRLKQMTKAASK